MTIRIGRRALAAGLLVAAAVCFAPPTRAGVASALPAIISGSVLVNNSVAIAGNQLTYSTQVPLANNTVYYIYVKTNSGLFNGLPAVRTLGSSNSPVLQAAISGATGQLSNDGTFAVYTLAMTSSNVPVNSVITFAPSGSAGNDGSIDNLASLAAGGGFVNVAISIGTSANLNSVLSDEDS